MSRMLLAYLQHVVDGQSILRCAARLHTGWNAAKRAVGTVRKTIDLIRKEITLGNLPKKPDRPDTWQTFIHIFSYAFFPHRFLKNMTNTKRLF